MSDHRGQEQDPAERLAGALRRIAIGIERREAVAAATQAALDGASRAAGQPPVAARTADRPPDAPLPAVAAELDALIGRLRSVLESLPIVRAADREG